MAGVNPEIGLAKESMRASRVSVGSPLLKDRQEVVVTTARAAAALQFTLFNKDDVYALASRCNGGPASCSACTEYQYVGLNEFS